MAKPYSAEQYKEIMSLMEYGRSHLGEVCKSIAKLKSMGLEPIVTQDLKLECKVPL